MISCYMHGVGGFLGRDIPGYKIVYLLIFGIMLAFAVVCFTLISHRIIAIILMFEAVNRITKDDYRNPEVTLLDSSR